MTSLARSETAHRHDSFAHHKGWPLRVPLGGSDLIALGCIAGTLIFVVSYAAQTDVMSLTYSLGDFIRDAVTRGYLQNSWYLTNVFSGFEIWSGGVGLETKDFAVTVP